MAISIPPKPPYLPFYSSLPSSFSLTLPLKPKSRSLKLLCCLSLKLLCCGLCRWWHWWPYISCNHHSRQTQNHQPQRPNSQLLLQPQPQDLLRKPQALSTLGIWVSISLNVFFFF